MPAVRNRDTQDDLTRDLPPLPSFPDSYDHPPSAFKFEFPPWNNDLNDSPFLADPYSPCRPDISTPTINAPPPTIYSPTPRAFNTFLDSPYCPPDLPMINLRSIPTPFPRYFLSPSPPLDHLKIPHHHLKTSYHHPKPSQPASASIDIKCRPRKGGKDYIPRPENAFILFRRKVVKDRQQALGEAAADPMTKKQRHADLSKAIGQQWKTLQPEERRHWEDLAKEKKKEHERLYPNYASRPARERDRVGIEKNRLRTAELGKSGPPVAEQGDVPSTSSEARNDHSTPSEASNAHENPSEARNNHHTPPETHNAPNHNTPPETSSAHDNPSEAQNNHNTTPETHDTPNHNTPSEAINNHDTRNITSESESDDRNNLPNGQHDQGPTIFSHSSGFTISGGQFNNVHGDQVNSVAFHAFGLPQFIQFHPIPDESAVTGLLGSIPVFLYDQLSLLASSLDLSVVQLLFLLTYHSFEPQVIQLISGTPLRQLLG
ncbi:rox1p [Moniliophthora roreri]|uniref:HMG box domain-containing protein n=1 Tax=Moniliophthora roreri TaxID=221103 RepID=A0A0W0F611_MONRR|nr:rox1p [Moniliophthora roreri]